MLRLRPKLAGIGMGYNAQPIHAQRGEYLAPQVAGELNPYLEVKKTFQLISKNFSH